MFLIRKGFGETYSDKAIGDDVTSYVSMAYASSFRLKAALAKATSKTSHKRRNT